MPGSRRKSSPSASMAALMPATTSSCSAQPLGGEAVGDRQPRRVVGERQVVVAEAAGGLDHLLDRRAAVGPVGVGVQVALDGGADRLAALGQRPLALLAQVGELLRDLARRGLHHDRRRRRADTRDLLQGLVRDPAFELALGQVGQRPRCLAIRLDPTRVLPTALLPVGDLRKRLDPVHVSHPAVRRPAPRLPRRAALFQAFKRALPASSCPATSAGRRRRRRSQHREGAGQRRGLSRIHKRGSVGSPAWRRAATQRSTGWSSRSVP